MSGDPTDCPNLEEGCTIGRSEYNPGMRLNTVQREGELPTAKDYLRRQPSEYYAK